MEDGVNKNPHKLIDLTGNKFGKWTVLKRAKSRYGYRTYWLCKCECGKEKEVSGQTLKNGTSLCCKNCTPRVSLKTHGLCCGGKLPEYHIWNSIKIRCRNKNSKFYHRYGDRGIDICNEWFDSFPAFYSYLGKKPFKRASIDRIDNDKGYEPGNVRWATQKQQAGNTRKQPIIDGKKFCISSFSRENNIDRFFVSAKIKEGLKPKMIIDLKDKPKFKDY